MTPAIARADVRLLALVARLPFASTRHLAVLSGEPASAGAYRCAATSGAGVAGLCRGALGKWSGSIAAALYPTDLRRCAQLGASGLGGALRAPLGPVAATCKHKLAARSFPPPPPA